MCMLGGVGRVRNFLTPGLRGQRQANSEATRSRYSLMSRKQNNIQYGTSSSPYHSLTLCTVAKEPPFLQRMKEGETAETNKIEEKRRRRANEEIIDEDEAPQIVIREKDKDKIDAEEAKAFVAQKEGVKVEKKKVETPTTAVPSKPKGEAVSLGMKKAKKPKEVGKRALEEEKEAETPEKSRKPTPKKGKRLKLSFEED